MCYEKKLISFTICIMSENRRKIIKKFSFRVRTHVHNNTLSHKAFYSFHYGDFNFFFRKHAFIQWDWPIHSARLPSCVCPIIIWIICIFNIFPFLSFFCCFLDCCPQTQKMAISCFDSIMLLTCRLENGALRKECWVGYNWGGKALWEGYGSSR